MSAVPQFLKRLEARIALALAKANAALSGIVSLSNHTSQTNAGVVGPGLTFIFNSAPFTSRTGKVLVFGTGLITAVGGTLASGDTTTSEIMRDGAAIPGFPGPYGGGLAGAGLSASASAGGIVDSVAPGSTHVWGIQSSIGGGHTAGYQIGEALITIVELPG
jgi:hypothetical protein